jgi:hypothetical protein
MTPGPPWYFEVSEQEGHTHLYLNGQPLLEWDSFAMATWHYVWWKPWTWGELRQFVEGRGRTVSFWAKPYRAELTLSDLQVRE